MARRCAKGDIQKGQLKVGNTKVCQFPSFRDAKIKGTYLPSQYYIQVVDKERKFSQCCDSGEPEKASWEVTPELTLRIRSGTHRLMNR